MNRMLVIAALITALPSRSSLQLALLNREPPVRTKAKRPPLPGCFA